MFGCNGMSQRLSLNVFDDCYGRHGAFLMDDKPFYTPQVSKMFGPLPGL